MSSTSSIPSAVRLHKASRKLELEYIDGECIQIPCELLRVYSPSAEVRGHGPGQATLQQGKRMVTIDQIQGVGNYALQFVFSDGHDSGIYSWSYLLEIGRNQLQMWEDYLQRLAHVDGTREPQGPVLIARQ